MLGRSPKAHKRLSEAFAEGMVQKRYLAIVEGVPAEESGTIDMMLVKTSTKEDGWRIIPAADGDRGAKKARTHWQLMATANGCALISFAPETGRTHQLRVHAASGLGMPIIGDPMYGSAGSAGLMLHAVDLTLTREDKPAITAHAPFPDRFMAHGFADPDAD